MAKKKRAKPSPELKPMRWPADSVERWPIEKLASYPRNPRTHTPEQIDKVAASIQTFGWTIPVLVDEKGMIIAGHARVQAARKMGLSEVPVMKAIGWDRTRKRAYVIADNQLTLLGGWDQDLLRLELGELKRLDFDLSLTGFDPDALVSYLASKAPPQAPSQFQTFGEDVPIDFECPSCHYKWSGSAK